MHDSFSASIATALSDRLEESQQTRKEDNREGYDNFLTRLSTKAAAVQVDSMVKSSLDWRSALKALHNWAATSKTTRVGLPLVATTGVALQPSFENGWAAPSLNLPEGSLNGIAGRLAQALAAGSAVSYPGYHKGYQQALAKQRTLLNNPQLLGDVNDAVKGMLPQLAIKATVGGLGYGIEHGGRKSEEWGSSIDKILKLGQPEYYVKGKDGTDVKIPRQVYDAIQDSLRQTGGRPGGKPMTFEDFSAQLPANIKGSVDENLFKELTHGERMAILDIPSVAPEASEANPEGFFSELSKSVMGTSESLRGTVENAGGSIGRIGSSLEGAAKKTEGNADTMGKALTTIDSGIKNLTESAETGTKALQDSTSTLVKALQSPTATIGLSGLAGVGIGNLVAGLSTEPESNAKKRQENYRKKLIGMLIGGGLGAGLGAIGAHQNSKRLESELLAKQIA